MLLVCVGGWVSGYISALSCHATRFAGVLKGSLNFTEYFHYGLLYNSITAAAALMKPNPCVDASNR